MERRILRDELTSFSSRPQHHIYAVVTMPWYGVRMLRDASARRVPNDVQIATQPLTVKEPPRCVPGVLSTEFPGHQISMDTT